MSQSQTIAAIAEALSKAQGAMKAAELDRTNPFFKSKYATIASVWEAIRKPLSDNGLCIVQVTRPEDGILILETRLLHASGEWLAGELVVTPVKNDPQGVGSALTYARRYGLAAIVGAVSDEDDDGEAGSGKQPQGRKAETKPTPAPTQAAPDNGHAQADADFAAMQSRAQNGQAPLIPPDMATPAQVQQLGILCKQIYGADLEKFRTWMTGKYNVKSRKELTKHQASEMIETLRKSQEDGG